MTRTRLYIEEALRPNTEIEIVGTKAHYASRVLRIRPGAELTLFDGRGGEYDARVDIVNKNALRVFVGAHAAENRESCLSVHLLQGLARGERMDLIVQKATELGVVKISPLLTEYSVVKLDAARVTKRLAHWHGISCSACEQCGRNTLPTIEAPIKFRDWLGQNVDQTDTRLLLQPGGPSTLRTIDALSGAVTVLIGPEGGFSDEELELATTTNFTAVDFGPRILRTETAAIAALAALQTLFGDVANCQGVRNSLPLRRSSPRVSQD